MAYDRLVLLDTEAKAFTAKAAGTISGGDLVMWFSGTDAVGSAVTTYAAGDIAVVVASGTAATAHETVIGVAQQTVTSGLFVNVLQQGIVVLPAGSNGVSGGAPVSFVGYANCVERMPTGSLAVAATPIGRALTTASAAGTFAVVRLNV